MKNYKQLFDELVNNGGFTCGWNQLEPPPSGRYICSITNNTAKIPKSYKELRALLDSVLSQKEYQQYIGNPNYCFGAWIDKDIVYVDINRIYDNLADALICGIEFGQKAIYDTVEKKVYDVPTLQTHGTEWQKETYKRVLIDKIRQS